MECTWAGNGGFVVQVVGEIPDRVGDDDDQVGDDGGRGLKGVEEGVEVADDIVKELVHQFGLLHFGDVDDDFSAGAGHPAGFGVGAAAAGEDEDAGIGPFKGR